jgi:branched-chain amino acid transport system permease protein
MTELDTGAPVVPDTAPPDRKVKADKGFLGRAGIVAAVLVVAIVLALVQSGSGLVVWQSVVTGILTGGLYGLIAMGLTLIFGVLDIVNFAHGAFLAVAMFISFGMVQATGLHPYLTLVVAVPVLFLLGAAVHRGCCPGRAAGRWRTSC